MWWQDHQQNLNLEQLTKDYDLLWLKMILVELRETKREREREK